VHMQAAEV